LSETVLYPRHYFTFGFAILLAWEGALVGIELILNLLSLFIVLFSEEGLLVAFMFFLFLQHAQWATKAFFD
jgi:hypothetical protein